MAWLYQSDESSQRRRSQNRLSQLIDRALEGEEVVITRHGHPVVALKPVAKPGRVVSATDLDWLAAHRVGRAAPT